MFEGYIKKDKILNTSLGNLGFSAGAFVQEQQEKIDTKDIKNSSLAIAENRFFVSKNAGIEKLNNDIKNSSVLIQGSGIAPLISQLAIATGMVFKQEIFTTDVDENRNPITLDRYIPTIKAPNYAYSEQMFYRKEADMLDLSKESLANGWSQKPGQTRQVSGESVDFKYAYEKQDIYYYAGEISFNEIKAQASKKIGLDLIAETISKSYERFNQRKFYNCMLGSSVLGTQGLLTMTAAKDVVSTDPWAINLGLTKPIYTMSFDELKTFAQNLALLAINNDYGYAGIMKKPTLIIPTKDFSNIKVMPFNGIVSGDITAGVFGSTYLAYLKANTGFEILPTSLAEKNNLLNPTGNAYNVYTIVDKSDDTYMRADVLDLSMYGGGTMHTANGVDYKGVLTAQEVFPFVVNTNKVYRVKIA